MYQQLDDDDVASDYLHLLRQGSVMRRLARAQHDAWRRAIRVKAHTDELRVRTWSRAGAPDTVWAVLPDWTLTAAERETMARRIAWQRDGED